MDTAQQMYKMRGFSTLKHACHELVFYNVLKNSIQGNTKQNYLSFTVTNLFEYFQHTLLFL